MELCPNGTLQPIHEANITDYNITYIQSVYKCIPNSQTVSIEWIVGVSVVLGFFVGLWIVCCICSRNASSVNVEPHTDPLQYRGQESHVSVPVRIESDKHHGDADHL